VLTLDPPGRLIDAGGYRLHVHALGAGEPGVVFVSGIAASCLNWAALQRTVARHTRAVATDRAGLGWSDPGPRGLTALEHATHLHAALDGAGVFPPYLLVAHSYGSFVVQLLARRHPGDVAGIVLLDPISWRDWVRPGPSQQRMLRGGVAFARVGAALAALGIVRFAVRRFRGGSDGVGRALLGSFGTSAVQAVSRVLGEVGKMPSDTWDAIQYHWSRPRAFIAMARHFQTLPLSAARVRDEEAAGEPWTFPLLVLGAGKNEELVRDEQQRIAHLSARGRYEVVAGAGHWVHLDRPDVVQRAILEALREVRGETGTA
jgi:pimeloyl-ACP methyl ester carboxylesterase